MQLQNIDYQNDYADMVSECRILVKHMADYNAEFSGDKENYGAMFEEKFSIKVAHLIADLILKFAKVNSVDAEDDNEVKTLSEMVSDLKDHVYLKYQHYKSNPS